MTRESAISIRDVSKKYHLFHNPVHRVIEALSPFKKTYHTDFWALRDIDLEVPKGATVGILGRNGSGKSTLLQIICGVLQPTQGSVCVEGRISALLELGAGFHPEFTGKENVILNGSFMGFSRKQMLERLPAIEAFADIGEFIDQPVKTYSSGMFVRLAFSAATAVDPNILVVDEALAVGDSNFQYKCYKRLKQLSSQGKTIVVVSHDANSLASVCDIGVVLGKGRILFHGDIKGAVNAYHDHMMGGGADRERPAKVLDAPEDGEAEATCGMDVDLCPRVPYYNEGEERIGNGKASIKNFILKVDGVPNVPVIPVGAVVDMEISVLFREDLENVGFGIALADQKGVPVLGTNDRIMGKQLQNVRKGEELTVHFLFKSTLCGGDYFLNIGCSQWIGDSEIMLDARRALARLTAEDSPHCTGVIRVDEGLSVKRRFHGES